MIPNVFTSPLGTAAAHRTAMESLARPQTGSSTPTAQVAAQTVAAPQTQTQGSNTAGTMGVVRCPSPTVVSSSSSTSAATVHGGSDGGTEKGTGDGRNEKLTDAVMNDSRAGSRDHIDENMRGPRGGQANSIREGGENMSAGYSTGKGRQD